MIPRLDTLKMRQKTYRPMEGEPLRAVDLPVLAKALHCLHVVSSRCSPKVEVKTFAFVEVPGAVVHWVCYETGAFEGLGS